MREEHFLPDFVKGKAISAAFGKGRLCLLVYP